MNGLYKLSIICLPVVIGCALPAGPDGTEHAEGSSSNSSNAFTVTGTALYEDGSPAAGQPVFLHTALDAGPDSAIRTTTDSGTFELPGLPEGEFGIEIRDDDGMAVYAGIVLAGEKDTVFLQPLVLRTTGAVTGTVACAVDSLCPGYDSLLVSLKGVWKSVWANAQGVYMITGVPEGTYGLRFDAPWAAAQSVIRIIDLENVGVVSGETTYVNKALLPARASIMADSAYLADAAVIQAILDSNGITDPLELFTGVQDNRIVVFADETGAIRRLPECIGRLDAMQVLMLHGGGITELPSSLGNLAGLLRLDLVYQGLTAVPGIVEELVSLEELNLNGNRLDTLDGVDGLENLRFLYAENNQLTNIPAVVGNLSMLRCLDISGNNLADLPDTVTALPYLNSVDVARNSLCDPAPAVSIWLDRVSPGWRTSQQCGN